MKIKTSWNLGLLYKNDTDPQIERDIVKVEKAYESFEKKYRNANYTASPEVLAKALANYENLTEISSTCRAPSYFHFLSNIDSSNSKASASLTKIEHRLTTASNKALFFDLKIAAIPTKKQREFLNSKYLQKYRYLLERLFTLSKHLLSEGEEQLESLLNQTSYNMWVEGQEKLLSSQTIRFKGEDMPLSSIIGNISNYKEKGRHEAMRLVVEKLKSISHFAEAEINAVYNYKKIMDERRKWPRPQSSAIYSYENDEKAVDNLTSLITKYFTVSKRFYKLHAKLLGKKKLAYADRNVHIGKINKKFTFDTTVDIVRTSLGKVDKEYAQILDDYLKNGQIDVYPRKGKRGGAYCAGMGLIPTFVLLNHVDDVRSVETLGHEMGHAVHAELSRIQPAIYRTQTLSTAEVASTFFEQITTEEIEKRLSEKERIIMLHNRISGDISTIFRQVSCYNFESELHKTIREKGQVSKEEISKLMAKHMRAYLGESIDMKDDEGFIFVTWSHIRSFFYVYCYAYAQLISRSMFAEWKKNPEFAKKVKQFLSAGRSMSPEDVFKSIGIDTSKPEFFEAGLKSIEEDITTLEKLTSKKSK